MATFKTRNPDVEIEFRTKSGPFIGRLVLSEKIDVGLVVNVSSPSLLIVEPFGYQEMVVIVSKQYALSKKRKLTMAELAQAPLIVRTRRNSTSKQILADVEQHGFELNVLMKCDSAQGVKVAVAKGLGVGLLYRKHVEQEIRRGELKVLNVPGLKMHIQSFIIYKAGKPLSPAAQAFLELLRQSPEAKPIRTRHSDHLKPTSPRHWTRSLGLKNQGTKYHLRHWNHGRAQYFRNRTMSSRSPFRGAWVTGQSEPRAPTKTGDNSIAMLVYLRFPHR